MFRSYVSCFSFIHPSVFTGSSHSFCLSFFLAFTERHTHTHTHTHTKLLFSSFFFYLVLHPCSVRSLSFYTSIVVAILFTSLPLYTHTYKHIHFSHSQSPASLPPFLPSSLPPSSLLIPKLFLCPPRQESRNPRRHGRAGGREGGRGGGREGENMVVILFALGREGRRGVSRPRSPGWP